VAKPSFIFQIALNIRERSWSREEARRQTMRSVAALK